MRPVHAFVASLLPLAFLLLAFASLTADAGALAPFLSDRAHQTLAELLPVFQGSMPGPVAIASFSETENSHLDDVSVLWQGVLWLFGGIVIALMLALQQAKKPWAAVRHGALITLLILALAAILPFQWLFDHFHALFFADRSWQFPLGSPMLALFPQSLFAAAFASILLRAASLAAACWVLGRMAPHCHYRKV